MNGTQGCEHERFGAGYDRQPDESTPAVSEAVVRA